MSRPRRMPGVLFVLLVLFALFAHLPGHAQIASADAWLSGLTYRLSDLAPNDGIAPSIIISPVNSSGRYVLSSSMAGSGFVHEFHVRGDPGTTDFVTQFGSASTSTGADFFHAAARLTTPTPTYRAFEGHNEYEFRFSMTPYTRIEFFADISLAATDPGGAVAASARLTMSGYIDALGEPGFDSFGFVRTVEDGNYAGQFYGELRSDADTAPSYFRMVNDANVTANLVVPPPVPEPATVSMLLVGLVIAGCAMRRAAGASMLHCCQISHGIGRLYNNRPHACATILFNSIHLFLLLSSIKCRSPTTRAPPNMEYKWLPSISNIPRMWSTTCISARSTPP